MFVRILGNDLCYDLKDTVYMVSLILFFGTRTQVFKTHKICIFPANLGRIASPGS